MTVTKEEIIANREKWAQALESGKYPQGIHYLRQFRWDEAGEKYELVGFCCLGVALDLFGEGEWADTRFILGGPDKSTGYVSDEQYLGGTAIGDDVEALLGLSTDQREYLATKNDNGTDFKTIAAAIREMDIDPIYYEGEAA